MYSYVEKVVGKTAHIKDFWTLYDRDVSPEDAEKVKAFEDALYALQVQHGVQIVRWDDELFVQVGVTFPREQSLRFSGTYHEARRTMPADKLPPRSTGVSSMGA